MATERAINMALRVVGIGEVERDFKRVGAAGEKGFEQVERAANGADRAVSDYTARLRRVVAVAKQTFDTTPGVAEARAQDPRGYLSARNDAITTAVEIEKRRIGEGLPEIAGGFDDVADAVDGAGFSLTRFALYGAAATGALAAIKKGASESLEAYVEHERALDQFQATLALTGNRSQATGDQIEQMAERVVAGTLQTRAAALQAASSLATVPGLTQQGLEAALDASSRLADKLQTDVGQVINDIVRPAFLGLAEGDMQAFYDATHDKVSPALQKLVIDLAEAGRTADAQTALIDGLRRAAGDDPNGLTTATDRATKAWVRFKIEAGERIAGPVAAGLDFITGALGRQANAAENAAVKWGFLLSLMFRAGRPGFAINAPDPNFQPDNGFAREELEKIRNERARRELERRFGEKPKPDRAGGRSGKSDADREAERLKREAEQARSAADRVIESNAEVVQSYRERVVEAQAKIGLEGEALAAIERQLEIEAAVRRINTELIDKEVEARRAAAAAAGMEFDAARATAEATDMVEAQRDMVRGLAGDMADANREIGEFAARQAQAKAILEQIRTPMEALNTEIEGAIERLRTGDLTADQFNRRMEQLAERLADINYEADRGAHAWRGFGNDVGRTLSDIALNGGDAMDVLQELIRLPLERLLFENVESPIALWIDSLTGNNRAENVADAREGLPTSGQVLGASVQLLDPAAEGAALSLNSVQAEAIGAAQALAAVAGTGNPIADLTGETERATASMAALDPVASRLGGTMAQVIASLAGGGGGGAAGLLQSVVGLAGAALGGGAGPNPALAGSAAQAIAENPGLFSSGTPGLPIGKPVWVGENGRELVEAQPGGRLRVHSNQDVRRSAQSDRGSTFIINQTNVIPERADARRTQSSIARGNQISMARAARKGIAAPAGSR